MSKQKKMQADLVDRDTFFNDLMAGMNELGEWARGEKELPITVREVPESASQETEQTVEYAVLYAYGEDGWEASVPDLPGCEAEGDTLEEAQNLIRYFIQRHLQRLRAEGKPAPEPKTRAEQVQVTA